MRWFLDLLFEGLFIFCFWCLLFVLLGRKEEIASCLLLFVRVVELGEVCHEFSLFAWFRFGSFMCLSSAIHAS